MDESMPSTRNGQDSALKLLRQLQRLNWRKERPEKSADLVREAMLCLGDWPIHEQRRFARVISDWLVADTLGMGLDLDEYEEAVTRRGEHAFQRFLSELKDGARHASQL